MPSESESSALTDTASPTWPVAPSLQLDEARVGPLPPSVSAEPAATGGWIVTFALASSATDGDAAGEVAVVGSFNGWDSTRHPMQRAADGRWRARVHLAGGVHTYKLAFGPETWTLDPENEEVEADALGGENSILRLGVLAADAELLARIRKGALVTEALEHDPQRALYRQRTPDHCVLLRYRVLRGDVEQVDVALRAASAIRRIPLYVTARLGAFEYWEATLDVDDQPLDYMFVLRHGEAEVTDPRPYRLERAQLPHLVTPEWAKHAVWYQILVDRFRNGDPGNDPPGVLPWTHAWYESGEAELALPGSFYEHRVFQRLFGGDLAGVRQSLDYLQALGINALYFNPIFHAPGHHKYNATDFRHVDTGYGAGEDYAEATSGEDLLDPSTWTWTPSDRVFLDLLRECKRRGMRVILDGVFNHVGRHHPAFVDVQREGRGSRFADWFDIRSWEPFAHVGWAGHPELPVFAKSPNGFLSPQVKAHIFAITRRWMDPDGDGDPSDGIDGWRLDVPMEVAGPFWKEWRDLVKSINPEAYITGEVWDLAESWLDGERFDGVMNYRFADATVAWIGYQADKLTASEYERRLALVRLAYPAEANGVLLDLLDSHDTDRCVSMMLNPDRPYARENREQLEGSTYDARRPDAVHYQRLRLAVLMQMTYVGAPMVYYGDEVGMWGSDDPNNRKPMFWRDLEPYGDADARVDGDLLEHYRAVIGLRRRHEALRVGSFETVLVDDTQDLLVFRRVHGAEELLVGLTPSSGGASFTLPSGRWRALLPDVAGALSAGGETATIEPIAGQVWLRCD